MALRKSSSPAVARQTNHSAMSRRVRLFWSRWENRLGSMILLVLLLVCLFPASWLPAGRAEADLILRHLPPMTVQDGSRFVLGTDALGRDLLSRLVVSTRLTLLIAGLSTILASVAGTAAGLTSGYFGGWVDNLITRLVDILLAFPVLLLALALVAAMGSSVFNLVIVLALSGWAGYTRVIRSSVLSLREREFVEAARSMGATPFRIILKHLLPNVISPILVLSTFNLARFILTESAISFLGLGPAPPDVTWGGIIGEGRNYMYEAWWVAAAPGAAIVITVLVFNFLGDAVRDAYDPYTVGSRGSGNS